MFRTRLRRLLWGLIRYTKLEMIFSAIIVVAYGLCCLVVEAVATLVVNVNDVIKELS